MALIKCPECGRSFSDKAASCPECGCPVDYAREEAARKEQENEQVYVSHQATSRMYSQFLEQEWDHYLDFHDKYNRMSALSREAAGQIADGEIRVEEDALAELQRKRAALKMFAFSEKKAMDEKIIQQAAKVEERKRERKERVTSLWLTLSCRSQEPELVAAYPEQLKPVLQIQEEYVQAKEQLMFQAEYGWDLTDPDTMSHEEFEKGFRDRFIETMLGPCMDQLGTVNLKTFAKHTGFSEEQIAEAASRYPAYVKKDPTTGEAILEPLDFNPALFKAPKLQTHHTGSIGSFGSVEIKGKSASVVGRAVLGGALAGPVGAMIGALSAAAHNNRKR